MKSGTVLRLLVSGTVSAMMPGLAAADEGMWLPEQLPALESELSGAGLQIPAAQLADVSQAPLGAIISLGGCSASFVSSSGLVITNHHCAVGALQQNSTAETNILRDGFVTSAMSEEVWAGPGSRVYVTDQITDVTAQVHAAIEGAADDRARFDAWDQVQKDLIAACEEPGGVTCDVVEYYGGQEVRLIRQVEIEDVRLVYAPPESIGYYGGEVDNWMWPRHTGDFAFFRAYVGPDGRPAAYSPENVPYQPAHWLQVNQEGVQDGEYVMVAGYPGRTFRYRTAVETVHAETVSYPWQIQVMTDVMALLEARMAEDPEAAVRLNTQYFGLSNYLKNNQGMQDGFVRTQVAQAAALRETAMREALAALPDNGGAELTAALDELNALLEQATANETRDRVLDWMLWNTRLVGLSSNLYFWSMQRANPDDMAREAGYQERDWDSLRERVRRVERSYDPVADERMAAYYLRLADSLAADARIEALDALLSGYRETEDPYAAAAAALYGVTQVSDAAVREQMMEWTPEQFTSSEDPLVRLAVAMEPLRASIREERKVRGGAELRLRPRYMEAVRLASSAELYPDANSTLRVTFGQVGGYTGTEGQQFDAFTIIQEIADKHTGEDPFNAPTELLAAIEAGETAGYQHQTLGTVPVAFLSDLDTTGGNSGSATLDGQGRLVGLLFDGNYESMASDWLFDTERTRSIHVDIRYVLWLMDRVFPAHHLLEEMGVESQAEVAGAVEPESAP
jgi:hypothetical protein